MPARESKIVNCHPDNFTREVGELASRMQKFCCELHVKAEFDHVAIMHDVILALHANFAFGFRLGH